MKTKLSILTLLILTGCSTVVPVVNRFPDAAPELLHVCPDLTQLDPNTKKLSDVINTVTDNYQKYYNCKDTVDSWIEWYNTQKQISNNIK